MLSSNQKAATHYFAACLLVQVLLKSRLFFWRIVHYMIYSPYTALAFKTRSSSVETKEKQKDKPNMPNKPHFVK